MPALNDETVRQLERKVEALRSDLEEARSALDSLAALVEETTELEVADVEAKVSGPRMSFVVVEDRDIPLKGTYERSGKRPKVPLKPPKVTVHLFAKGAVGTQGKMTITINGKEKSEPFELTKDEYFSQRFDYDIKVFLP